MNKFVKTVSKSKIAPATIPKKLFSTIAKQGATYSANTGKVLNDIAKKQEIEYPKISCYGQVGKGQGVTGDLFFVNIQDTRTNRLIELLVKQATSVQKVRDYFPVNALYQNESNFYNNVWPEFVDIQYSHFGSLFFDNVPKCYGTDTINAEECVILENLKSDNYTNIDKKQYMDQELFEIILKKYGQFHGLSYMFKLNDPRNFVKTSEKLYRYWEGAEHIVPLRVSINDAFQKCVTYLTKGGDQKLINKMQNYAQNGLELFMKSNNYHGKHGVFLHGDCWSNNMMFKFDNTGKVQDLKLIDFQTCKVGSAVFDLSYCLYSGGSKEIFDNLDYYIDLYHHSLTETCTKLGCNKFISLDELKKEWNEYCKFGWMMAMVILKAKLVRDDAKLDLLLMLNELEKRGSKAHLEDSDEEEVEKRTLVLIEHMNKNGYL